MRREELRGVFILVLLVAIAAAGVWITNQIGGTTSPLEMQPTGPGWSAADWQALAAWLTLLVLLGSLGFAARQVKEAVRLREAQTRPFVIVDFDVDGVLIHITIENTGSLAARDVQLEAEPSMRSTHDDPWPPANSTLLSQGIPMLPPGKKYRFFFDSFPVRLEQQLPMTYGVKVTYRADGRRRPFEDTYPIDLTFLMGLGEVVRRDLDDVARSLEEMGKHLRYWTENMNGLRVYVIDREKYQRETAIGLAWRGVRQRLPGGDPEEIRKALRKALKDVGEEAEPPQKWVEAIVEEKQALNFQLEDLDHESHD